MSADLPGDVHFENLSHHEVIGFSGQFELGAHYEGLQEEMLIDGTSIVREHRLVLISDLTLTEIETLPGPVPEPDSVLPVVGAVGVLMGSSLRKVLTHERRSGRSVRTGPKAEPYGGSPRLDHGDVLPGSRSCPMPCVEAKYSSLQASPLHPEDPRPSTIA